MDEKYLPSVSEQIVTLTEQINECKRIIYRNQIENLTFVENNEKAKIAEVAYNNNTLKEKIDVLTKELDRLNASGSNPTK